MPVRPSSLLRASKSLPLRSHTASPHQQPISTFLLPFLTRQAGHSQLRHASILSSLSDLPSAYSKRIRRGRGASSGKGKTSGRGHKGQKQHGKVPAGFSGGQTPLEKVKGVKGFVNIHTDDLTTVNLDRIQSWINQGRLDISQPITIRELQRSRCLHGVKDGVKLLARNAETLTSPIHITVSRASASAIAAVEAAGGSIQTRYYTHASIRRILGGTTHPTISLLTRIAPPSATPVDASTEISTESDSTTLINSLITTPNVNVNAALLHPPMSPAYKYRLPDPAARKDIEYYRDPAHRGYLSYQVEEGQSPSLFFRKPRTVKIAVAGQGDEQGEEDALRALAKRRAQAKAEKAEKLW